MMNGHPPFVAIQEAARRAEKEGMIPLILEAGQDLPVHFVLCDRYCVSFVRVRRLKYPGFAPEEIAISCARDVEALREIAVMEEIFRELWVRGPDRSWHRYLVLRDEIEELEGWDNDEKDPEGVPPSPPELFPKGTLPRALVLSGRRECDCVRKFPNLPVVRFEEKTPLNIFSFLKTRFSLYYRIYRQSS